MELLRKNMKWLESNKYKTDEAKLENVLKCMEIVLRVMGSRCNARSTCCETIGLDKPPKLDFSNKDLLEAAFDRESFISKHLADEPDDGQQQSATSTFYENNYKSLNNKQKRFVDKVTAAVKHQYDFPDNAEKRQRKFFLTGDGGTGKSHAAKVR